MRIHFLSAIHSMLREDKKTEKAKNGKILRKKCNFQPQTIKRQIVSLSLEVEGDNLSLSKLLTPDKLSNCLLFLWQITSFPLQWWSIFDNLSEVHENFDKLYPSLGVTSTIHLRSIKTIFPPSLLTPAPLLTCSQTSSLILKKI